MRGRAEVHTAAATTGRRPLVPQEGCTALERTLKASHQPTSHADVVALLRRACFDPAEVARQFLPVAAWWCH